MLDCVWMCIAKRIARKNDPVEMSRNYIFMDDGRCYVKRFQKMSNLSEDQCHYHNKIKCHIVRDDFGKKTVLCVCSASSTSPVCSPFQSAERDGTALTCLVRDRIPSFLFSTHMVSVTELGSSGEVGLVSRDVLAKSDEQASGKLVFDALIRWVKIDYTSMDNVCSVSCRQAGHFLAHLTIRDH
ncbi:hypothetical protein T01_7844 [Trichinella spiralis]|uniref:Uncharacterized protein n=1 Tax=Trichinella spiralis TaxID=6334 RepID=A0A0V1BIU4_TRISP|nr:hypothetical protein T01_7844 [Trichinella spiralis]